jgi:hypothetical protein
VAKVAVAAQVRGKTSSQRHFYAEFFCCVCVVADPEATLI